MVLDKNEPYISTFHTNLRKVCLSVILEFCLSVVVGICVLAPAYTCLYRGLKYLPTIIGTLFYLIFGTIFLGRSATLPYVWKIRHKNERHLRLVAQIFTKLSQNVCLISIHILIYWHARCNCKLWNAHWLFCVLYKFSNKINNYSYLNCCIFIKL